MPALLRSNVTSATAVPAPLSAATVPAHRRTYASLWDRLIANTAEPANSNSCWQWTAKRDRWGYGRFNLYVPLLSRVVTLQAHIAAYAWLYARATDADSTYLAYLEVTHSGLELDHVCVNPGCIYPGHLELETPSRNCALRHDPLRTHPLVTRHRAVPRRDAPELLAHAHT